MIMMPTLMMMMATMTMIRIYDNDGDVGESMLTGQNAFPGQVALEVERNLIV